LLPCRESDGSGWRASEAMPGSFSSAGLSFAAAGRPSEDEQQYAMGMGMDAIAATGGGTGRLGEDAAGPGIAARVAAARAAGPRGVIFSDDAAPAAAAGMGEASSGSGAMLGSHKPPSQVGGGREMKEEERRDLRGRRVFLLIFLPSTQ
jgi:hypothetical protein